MDKVFYSVDEFMEYYGLIEIPEDEYMTESIKTAIGKASRSLSDWSEIKKTWNNIISRFVKKTVEKTVPKKDADKIIETYKKAINSKGFHEYKRKFDDVCKLVGIPSNNTTIESIWVGPADDNKGMHNIKVKYSSGRKRVIIPNGLRLSYTSSKPNVKELIPRFKGKGSSKLCFSSPRCYFKLSKETPNVSDSGNSVRYTPKNNFQTAYIDAMTTGPNGGVVYIDSSFPIQLVKFKDKMKEVYKESYNDILDSKLFCYERYNKNELDKNELNYLLERIDENANILRDSDTYYSESVKSKIGYKTQQRNDMKALKDFWNRTAIRTIVPKVYYTTAMTDEKFMAVKEAFEGMRKENIRMSEYMKHFMTVSKICHIPPHECIIRKYTLKKGKHDKNSVWIEFATAGTKLTIPSGCKLYHKSPIGTLPYLQPQFRGRSAKGHLYSSPRVYCSIHRDMGKSHADIVKGDNAYTYEVVENIKYVYVDPLVPFHMTGAIYISTNHPIKIKRLDKIIAENNKKGIAESTDDPVIEGPTFASLDEFVQYYGLEYADDTIEESSGLKSDVGKKIQHTTDLKAVKKAWNIAAKKFDHKSMKKKINVIQRKKLNDAYEIMKKTTQYSEYKPKFDEVCKFFGLTPDHVIIEHLHIGKDTAKIDYSAGVQKVVIPAGTRLIHVSPVNDITALKPTFKSKVSGAYMYSSNRCFFTLAKDIPANKAGLEGQTVTKYTPVETIRTAYIDQACTSYGMGAVYVDSNYPIKVRPFSNDTVKESVIDAKVNIFTSLSLNEITESECECLIKTIDRNDQYNDK